MVQVAANDWGVLREFQTIRLDWHQLFLKMVIGVELCAGGHNVMVKITMSEPVKCIGYLSVDRAQ